jgi:uncharacterized protein (DUF2141 family)
MRKYFNIYVVLSGLILASCAQIVNPTGGERDFKAPEIVSIYPKNYSTNFDKKSVEIKFNEFIQLNNPSEQIIISPPLESKPEFVNKGRTLEIKFKEKHQSNTTYTINFGNAIGDNKENNLVKNFVYVLSTGSSIDSNFIAGKIENAFTNQPENNVTIGLYDINGFDDSTTIKYKPIYMSKTNESGLFTINNLPAQTFKIIAFKDENKNLKKEVSEQVAFLNNNVNTTDSNNHKLNLKLFKPELYKHGRVIDTFSREPDKFVFVVYKPKGVVIKEINGNKTYQNHIKTINGIDTFYVFTSTQKTDSVLNFNSTINGKTDVISVKQKVLFKASKPTFTISKQIELNDTIKINFNSPLLKFDTSRIVLTKDSVHLNYKLIKTNDFELQLIYPWEEKTTYRLNIKDSAFVDYYNQRNKAEKVVYAMKSLKDYANLLLHVKVGKKSGYPYLLQLVSSDEKKVHYEFNITKNQDINIQNILPGSYKLKVVFDENNNGIWDNGDFNTNTQPEKVKYLTEQLTLKAYWDLEQSVLIE